MRITTRYIIYIIAILLTIALNQLIIQHLLKQKDEDAHILNIAGRQRMLSQNIVKLVYNINDDIKSDSLADIALYSELEQLKTQFKKVHFGLKNGSLELGLSGVISKKSDSLLSANTSCIMMIVSQVDEVLKSRDVIPATAIDKLREAESEFLITMEKSVDNFEIEAFEKQTHLKMIEVILSCLTILLLALEFVFIIVPIIKTIRNNNRKLETANKQLKQVSERLILQNSQLTEFTHITSHNLRAPVSNLHSLVKLYLASDNEDEKQYIWKKFEVVIDHLASTLNHLIEAFKIRETNQIEVEIIKLKGVLKKTREILAGQIINTGTEIEADFSVIDEIAYNRIYMESIFLNLMTNSIKYRDPDRPLKIKISTGLADGKKFLKFSDNGLGMDLTSQGDKLFQLYRTFHGNSDAKGIGLFLTKTQVEAMGGSIEATSKIGHGTSFVVWF